jgi:hypothetical protein
MHRLNKKYVEERNAPAGVFGESYGKSQDKGQTDSVYTSVNVQPEFPGGYTALCKGGVECPRTEKFRRFWLNLTHDTNC